MKNKALYAVGLVLLILIITNPSQKAFKEYMGSTTYRGLRRTGNFFLFSIYNDNDEKYLALLGNFYEIDTDPFKPYGGREFTQSEIDSAKMADSSKMKMADTVSRDTQKSIWKPPAKDKLVDTTNWRRYEIQDPLNLMNLPYKERVYWALRDNVDNFNFTKAEFYLQLKNPRFQVDVYNLLQQHLSGFTKTKSEFLKKISQN